MKKLPVNLDELAFVLHRGNTIEMECFLNLDSGEIVSIPTDREVLKDVLKIKENINMLSDKYLVEKMISDSSRFMRIPNNFSQIVFELMSNFVPIVENTNPMFAQKLERIIHGEGGFSEFHKHIKEHNRYITKFVSYRDLFFERATIKWLNANDIEPRPVKH